MSVGKIMEYGNGVSSTFKVLVSILLLLNELERVPALEFGPGSWLSEAAVTTSSSLLPSSLSERPQALEAVSGDGSGGLILMKEEALVADEATFRRKLTAYSYRSFIGYGVLSAGYTPCPPRSGRSYYTNNCRSSSRAVRPYSRGCSRISLCARD